MAQPDLPWLTTHYLPLQAVTGAFLELAPHRAADRFILS